MLYRLPEFLAANPLETVFVTEGEKDTDRLIELGLLATTNPGGCIEGWKDDYTACLAGRQVVVLADRDRPGARHAGKVEMALLGRAAAVVVLNLPRLKRSEDVSDWLDFHGGTRAELVGHAEQLLRKERSVPPPSPKKGHRNRHALFSSKTLEPSERLLLLAIQHYSAASAPLTANDLARVTGLHRVTVQNLITRLRRLGVLIREKEALIVQWNQMP